MLTSPEESGSENSVPLLELRGLRTEFPLGGGRVLGPWTG